MSRAIDVAVVSSKDLRDLNEDDRILVDALRTRGLTARAVAWRGEPVDWWRVGMAVVRSTWDYSTRCSAFLEWARTVNDESILVNGLEVVRWNLDKRYLTGLAGRGCPVVPTKCFERGRAPALDATLHENGWDEGVIKPVVSAGGRDTYRVRRGDAAAAGRFARLVAREAMMVQPFLHRILDEGEVSLMFIDRVWTHAVLKRARPGEYRVQDDHGGSVHAFEPDAALVERAASIVDAVEGDLVYARVDLARDAAGSWVLMELELVEPELFLRYSAESVARLVTALETRLSGRGAAFRAGRE